MELAETSTEAPDGGRRYGGLRELGSSSRPCEQCGGPCRVRILVGYSAGERVVQNLCLICAERPFPSLSPEAAQQSKSRLTIPLCLVLIGACFVFLGGFGDLFGLRSTPGFGWHQRLGVSLGGLLVIVATILRVDVVGIIGTLMFAAAAGSDLVDISDNQAMGWKHHLVNAIGLTAALLGIALQLRASLVRRRARSAGAGPKSDRASHALP